MTPRQLGPDDAHLRAAAFEDLALQFGALLADLFVGGDDDGALDAACTHSSMMPGTFAPADDHDQVTCSRHFQHTGMHVNAEDAGAFPG